MASIFSPSPPHPSAMTGRCTVSVLCAKYRFYCSTSFLKESLGWGGIPWVSNSKLTLEWELLSNGYEKEDWTEKPNLRKRKQERIAQIQEICKCQIFRQLKILKNSLIKPAASAGYILEHERFLFLLKLHLPSSSCPRLPPLLLPSHNALHYKCTPTSPST